MSGAFCTNCGRRLPPLEPVCRSCGTVGGGRTGATAALPVTEDAAPLAEAPVSSGPALFVRRGPNAGAIYDVSSSSITVGRDPDTDIFLNHPTVSRRHLEIRREATMSAFVDVGSYNGTYLNGRRADAGVLSHGDELQVGLFKLVYLEGS